MCIHEIAGNIVYQLQLLALKFGCPPKNNMRVTVTNIK